MNSIFEVVSLNNVNDDSLSSYYSTDRIAKYFRLTLEDLRCSILNDFVKAIKKNGVTSDTRLCLVFDSAGSAKFEKLFVLVAIQVLNISDIHVILADVNFDSRPDMNDLPVTVEFVDGDSGMLEAIKRICADGYQVMLNAVFIQKVFYGNNLIQDMITSLDKRIQCMNMCLPYGIYFNYSDYAERDSALYSVHPICKNFQEYIKLLKIGCNNGVG